MAHKSDFAKAVETGVFFLVSIFFALGATYIACTGRWGRHGVWHTHAADPLGFWIQMVIGYGMSLAALARGIYLIRRYSAESDPPTNT